MSDPPGMVPITEESPVGGTSNPYGTSKCYRIERILSRSLCRKLRVGSISLLHFLQSEVGAFIHLALWGRS